MQRFKLRETDFSLRMCIFEPRGPKAWGNLKGLQAETSAKSGATHRFPAVERSLPRPKWEPPEPGL